MLQAYADHWALITGASSGIGLGIARRLTADGAQVFTATRSKEDLQTVLDQVNIAGGFVGELQQAGVAAVYTPKDFELNRIMADIVRIVDRTAA